MLFGAHMPTRGGVWNAILEGRRIGCDIVQLFVKNNMQWMGKAFEPATVSRFFAERDSANFSAMFAHAGYLINLAAPAGPNRDRSLQSLIQEIELATTLKLPFL